MSIKSFDLEPAAIEPGGLGQLIHLTSAACTLKGFQFADGIVPVRLIAGPNQIAANEAGELPIAEGGLSLLQGTYVTAIVKNTGVDTVVAKGVVVLDGEFPDTAFASAEPVSLQALAAIPPPAPASSVQIAGITPGTNEVVVLLARSDCESLLRSVKGLYPILEHEKPNLVRRLQDALSR